MNDFDNETVLSILTSITNFQLRSPNALATHLTARALTVLRGRTETLSDEEITKIFYFYMKYRFVPGSLLSKTSKVV